MRTSSQTGRHTRRGRTAIPVTEFLTPDPNEEPRHRRRPRSTAPAVTQPSTALALAAATAVTLAFTPAIAPHAPALHLPTITAPSIHLNALVDPAEVNALQKAVTAELATLDSTVANIVGAPGQTLATALSAASSLSGTFWSALSAAAGNNPLLVAALKGLNTLTTGGLTALASTVTTGNNAIVLSTQQVSTLLTSTLAGAASTAVLALSGAVANPLSLAGLAAIIDAPFTIGGQVLSAAITAAANLGDNAIGVAASFVTTATAQINNVLNAVNDLVSGVGDASGSHLVAGVLTAVQAVVSAPVSALLAGVSGGATALAHAGTTVVNTLAGAAQDLNNIWLGGTTGNGAVQAIIGEIASGPMDVGHYVAVLTTLTQAALATVTKPVTTLVAGTAVVPIRFTADVVDASAHIVSALVTGAAGLAAGLGEAAGLPPALIGTIYTIGKALNASINLGAGVVTAGLNTAASLLDGLIHATGVVTPAAAVPATTKLPSIAAIKTPTSTDSAATGTSTKATTKATADKPTLDPATKPVAKDAANGPKTTGTTTSDPAAGTTSATSEVKTSVGAGKHAATTTTSPGPVGTKSPDTPPAKSTTPAKDTSKPSDADSGQRASGTTAHATTTSEKGGKHASQAGHPGGGHG